MKHFKHPNLKTSIDSKKILIKFLEAIPFLFRYELNDTSNETRYLSNI